MLGGPAVLLVGSLRPPAGTRHPAWAGGEYVALVACSNGDGRSDQRPHAPSPASARSQRAPGTGWPQPTPAAMGGYPAGQAKRW